MPIRVVCTECVARWSVPALARGGYARCPGCGTKVWVPRSAAVRAYRGFVWVVNGTLVLVVISAVLRVVVR